MTRMTIPPSLRWTSWAGALAASPSPAVIIIFVTCHHCGHQHVRVNTVSVVIINSMTDLHCLVIVVTVDETLASGAPRAGVEVHVTALGMTAKSESVSGSGSG